MQAFFSAGVTSDSTEHSGTVTNCGDTGVLCMLEFCVCWGSVYAGDLCMLGFCVCWGFVHAGIWCMLGFCVC